MSLHDIIFLLYFWSKESLQKDISYELQLDLSNVQEWFEYLREICFEYIEENSQIIGGLDENFEPIIVEIDENYFFHVSIMNYSGSIMSLLCLNFMSIMT